MSAAPSRVLHISAPARHGGLERVVTMMAHGQIRRGIHARIVTVLSPGDENAHPFVDQARAAGIPVDVLIVGGRAYRDEYKALVRLIAEHEPDVVHTHGFRSDVIGALAARRCRKPFVSTVHSFIGGRLRNQLNETIQRFALRYSAGVMAVSKPVADRLIASGVDRRRIHLLQNGFAPTSAPLSRGDARARLGLPPDAPDVKLAAWIGRLSIEKGADVMVDALAVAEPRWRLSVIGDGPEASRLRARADAAGVSDRIVWHGAVPDAATFLPAFDTFVLSSRTEGTPIALLEAMEAHIPVVAARVGGVPDVVGDAEAILVAPEDPAAIARALAKVLGDPGAATARADAARRRVRADFGMDRWLDRVDEVYRTALGYG